MIAFHSALRFKSNRTPVASQKLCRPCQALVDPRASGDRVTPHALDLGDPDRAVAQPVVAGVPTPVVSPASTNPFSTIANSPIVLWYLRVLDEKPLVTKQWTSLSGFVLGDILAQLLTEPEFLVSRTLTLAAYGFFIDAVAGHHFYEWLDKNIEPGRAKTSKAVGKKIAIDQLIYAPIFTCVLYAYLSTVQGDFSGIPVVLSDKVVPTLMANYAVWPLAHALNFYYVPTEQRILYNNFIAVCWTTWLSCLAH